MQRRRPSRGKRGNVILTALFISVFLFFLSVALLLQNKQDIALSLSMEHKLKAEMAARSVAFEAYGHLREHGKLNGPLGLPLEKDVTTNVELVEMAATQRRGKLLEIRAKGTSGPFSSYFTMILQPTELANPQGGAGKVMFLPRSGESALAIYGDFELIDLKQEFPGQLWASGGPVFTASQVEESTPPAFEDSLPVFGDDGIQGVGPAIVLAPPLGANQETALQWLQYKGGSFEWQQIAPPGNLSSKPADPATERFLYEMQGGGEGWTNASVQGVEGQLKTWLWTDSAPPTNTVEEAQGLTASAPVEASPLSPRTSGSDQQYFSTRGTLAASGDSVYTHAWHYLYRPYRGGSPDTVTALTGSVLTRWPCVLKYSVSGSSWSTVWAPLREDGSVESELVPDPNALWVTSEGVIYSLNSSDGRRLMTLGADGKSEVSDKPLPEGEVFLYRDQPYLLEKEPSRIVNLLDSSVIDFSSLPTGIPGNQGIMLLLPEFTTKRFDEPGTNDLSPEGAWKIEGYEPRTVLPDFLINYSLGEGVPFSDGQDLYAAVEIGVSGVDSIPLMFDKWYIKEVAPQGGSVMARYDGTNWHILPNGLRAFLERNRNPEQETLEGPTEDDEENEEEEEQKAPGESLEIPPGLKDAVMATYSGLPSIIPRYAVISISTDPFEMSYGE